MAIFAKLQKLRDDERFYSAPEFTRFDKEMTLPQFSEMFAYDNLMYGGLWQIMRAVERGYMAYKGVLGLCITKTARAIVFVQILWRIANRDAKEHKKEIWAAYKLLVEMRNNLNKFKKTAEPTYVVAAIKLVEKPIL